MPRKLMQHTLGKGASSDKELCETRGAHNRIKLHATKSYILAELCACAKKNASDGKQCRLHA